jgi:predicted HTH transcriptional regulator
LLFDIKKQEKNPGLPDETYRSDQVLFATLKTICALLNTDGGVLLIGVSDQSDIVGIERDFCFSETNDADRWQLCLRDNIRGKFHDGKSINDYVDMAMEKVNEKTIAYIRVTPRRRLSFLRDQHGMHAAYRRQGNRSEALAVTEIEEFLRSRWEHRD